MRFVAALIAMAALCKSADAQAAECKSLTDPATRLACYDKANPADRDLPNASAQTSTPLGSSHGGRQYGIRGFAR